MAIRNQIRRAVRKSDQSDSTSPTNSDTTLATAMTVSETSSLHKMNTSSTLSKVFSFTSRHRSGARSGDSGHSRNHSWKKLFGSRKPLHPSKRPLTAQNLIHQEMLGRFTMTFGATDPSQIESLSFCGISPCCTRPASIDLARIDMMVPPDSRASRDADR